MANLKGVRPLYHPAVGEITVEGVLYALSDPVRVAIYAQIATEGCAQSCSNFLTVSEQPIPKSTLSQHFRILRENGLIRGERHGVEMRHTARCAEIDVRFPGLIRAILNAYAVQSGQALRRPGTASSRKTARRTSSSASGVRERR